MTGVGRAALALIAGLIAPGLAISQEPLSIGARTDAPPFSYRNDTGAFEGYLVDICRLAAQKLDRPHLFKKVEAASRFEMIASGDVDFLCDPTTVSITRLKEYDFSPILFVSGSSYLSSVAADDVLRNSSWANFDKQVASGASIRNRFGDLRADDGSFPEPRKGAVANLPDCADVDAAPDGRILGARVGMLGGTTARKAIEIASDRNIVRMNRHDTACIDDRFKTHTEGVAALCEGKISYYFGDRDILASVLAQTIATQKNDCDASIAKEFFTIEPYGLAISDKDPQLRRDLIAAILEVHREQVQSPDGGLELRPSQLFRKHFPNKRASGLLNSLYVVLNAPE